MSYEEGTSPCRVEEDDQTNILQGKLGWQLLGLFNFVAMMTNRARLRHGAPFGAEALFGEDIHPFFRTLQADQGHACSTLLVRNWCCSRKAGDWCFPRQQNVRQKKRKKRGRKSISFRADCKFRGRKSQRLLKQKVFVLSPAPLFEHVQPTTSPKLGFALCLYLDKHILRRDTSTFLAVKKRLENGTPGSIIRVGNLTHYSG